MTRRDTVSEWFVFGCAAILLHAAMSAELGQFSVPDLKHNVARLRSVTRAVHQE